MFLDLFIFLLSTRVYSFWFSRIIIIGKSISRLVKFSLNSFLFRKKHSELYSDFSLVENSFQMAGSGSESIAEPKVASEIFPFELSESYINSSFVFFLLFFIFLTIMPPYSQFN